MQEFLLTHIHHAVQVRVDLQGLVLEGVEGVHRCDIPSSKFGKQLLHLSEIFNLKKMLKLCLKDDRS